MVGPRGLTAFLVVFLSLTCRLEAQQQIILVTGSGAYRNGLYAKVSLGSGGAFPPPKTPTQGWSKYYKRLGGADVYGDFRYLYQVVNCLPI